MVSAITKARLAEREMTEQDLIMAVTIVPLSRTMKEQINHIRAGRSSGRCGLRRVKGDDAGAGNSRQVKFRYGP